MKKVIKAWIDSDAFHEPRTINELCTSVYQASNKKEKPMLNESQNMIKETKLLTRGNIGSWSLDNGLKIRSEGIHQKFEAPTTNDMQRYHLKLH